MHENDEHENDRHPLTVVEQSVWKRHHRKPLNASLGFLYHRVDDLPAPCSHLFDVLYVNIKRNRPLWLLALGQPQYLSRISLPDSLHRYSFMLADNVSEFADEVVVATPLDE